MLLDVLEKEGRVERNIALFKATGKGRALLDVFSQGLERLLLFVIESVVE